MVNIVLMMVLEKRTESSPFFPVLFYFLLKQTIILHKKRFYTDNCRISCGFFRYREGLRESSLYNGTFSMKKSDRGFTRYQSGGDSPGQIIAAAGADHIQHFSGQEKTLLFF